MKLYFHYCWVLELYCVIFILSLLTGKISLLCWHLHTVIANMLLVISSSVLMLCVKVVFLLLTVIISLLNWYLHWFTVNYHWHNWYFHFVIAKLLLINRYLHVVTANIYHFQIGIITLLLLTYTAKLMFSLCYC